MNLRLPQVDFVCTAGERVGFGHVRRCLALARELARSGIPARVGGALDAAARALVARELPEAATRDAAPPAPLAVLDCMFDPQDPDHYDLAFVGESARRHARTLLITSALDVPPALPVDVVVGHMLGPVESSRFTLHRGLDWAPVDPAATDYREIPREYPPEPRRVLVAFGNWHDPAGLLLALDALQFIPTRPEVQVLLPSALSSQETEVRRRAGNLRLTVLRDVPSVFPLLRDADLLVGSYGNLTFEALALGLPTVVVAIKPFMAAYAARLETQGCLVCAGEVGSLNSSALALRLSHLDRARRQWMGLKGRRLVDGAGLRRLATLLAQEAAAASPDALPGRHSHSLPAPLPTA